VLDVLFWGLKASPAAWTSSMKARGKANAILTIQNFFKAANVFQFLVIKTLDPDWKFQKLENTVHILGGPWLHTRKF
jgi:hypothetical protein